MESRVCWFCKQGEDESEAALIRPCRCISDLKWAHGSCINRWVVQGHVIANPCCRFCHVCYRLSFPALPIANRLLEKIEPRLDCWLLKLLYVLVCWHLFFLVFETKNANVFQTPTNAFTERRFLPISYGVVDSTVFTFTALILLYLIIVPGPFLMLMVGIALRRLEFIREPTLQTLEEFGEQLLEDWMHHILPSSLRRLVRLPPVAGSLMATRRFMLIVCLIACDWMDFHEGETPRWIIATVLSSLALSYWHSYHVFRRNTSANITVLPFDLSQ